MPYFTSWDVNVLLCLVKGGLPEDVVKGIVKMAKKSHKELSLEGARKFHCMNIKPIHDYISFKTAWDKRRDVGFSEAPYLRLTREELHLIRKPGKRQPRESIKQHIFYRRVMEEYDKGYCQQNTFCSPRVILLDRMLMGMSTRDRHLWLDELMEKIPVEKIIAEGW